MEGPGKIKHSRPVPPFLRWCSATIPAAFDDSLTYYEALCSLWKWLQTNLVEVVNNNATVTQEYIKMVDDLKEYVDNYFENLDVQEEINNKLDEMAEDGTLDAIINNYDKVLFVAPKHINESVSSFDANLILYRNKSIAIDVGYSAVYQSIVDMYSNYNVSSLDYVIISHWDTDHIGNLGAMVTNGIINENTVVYLPAEPSYVNQTQVANVKTTLTNANVSFITPTTGDTLEIDLLKFTFLNCDLETLEQYAGMDDARNLMSTVVLIEHKDVKALYTGDADGKAFENIYNNNQINCQIDLYKIGHHGFNRYTFQPFIKSISPKYALQTATLSRMADGSTSDGEQITLLNQLGTKIYPCGIQKEYIEFLSDGYDIHVQKGEPLTVSYFTNSKDVYVDISVDRYAYQDGTQDHPYKELSYALACTANYVGDVVTFHIANGVYGVTEAQPTSRVATVYLNNLKFTPVLKGNSEDNTQVKLYGINGFKSSFVVYDLTIYSDYRDAIYVRDCDAKLNNVKITTVGGSASSHNAIVSYRSTVSLDTCAAEYADKFIVANGSTISIIGTTATNIEDGELIPVTGDNIFNIKSLNNDNGSFAPSYYNPPIMVFDGTSGSATTTATINGQFSDYQEMEITLNTPGSRTITTGVLYNPRNGLKIPVTSTSISATNGIIFSADVEFSNNNTISITNQVRYQINRATGDITVTALSSTDLSIHDIRAKKTVLLTDLPSA